VVLDAQALHEAARPYSSSRSSANFPILWSSQPVTADDETSLAGLISAGLVYRFIHKPMSPARAKIVCKEAAIKKVRGPAAPGSGSAAAQSAPSPFEP